MKDLRKVEVLRDNNWTECRLKDVKKGEKFRMFEFDGSPVLGSVGESVFVADSDPYVGPNGPEGADVWTIGTIDHKDDDRPLKGEMDW